MGLSYLSLRHELRDELQTYYRVLAVSDLLVEPLWNLGPDWSVNWDRLDEQRKRAGSGQIVHYLLNLAHVLDPKLMGDHCLLALQSDIAEVAEEELLYSCQVHSDVKTRFKVQ